ncbi:MAG: hypothetical protein HYY06_29995 [Deltaproteobacteria bacterium]|nr:hypothetical protein [Deltaproteobacteria bacterium]
MKVESKFMNGEVRLESLELSRGGLVAVGMLKEMFPVRVILDREDAIALAKVLSAVVVRRLPASFSRFLSSRSKDGG